jgi:hypothetical protein
MSFVWRTADDSLSDSEINGEILRKLKSPHIEEFIE